jgi:O-Antigen ligase
VHPNSNIKSEKLNLITLKELSLNNLVQRISIAFAYISVWEIILGLGGDLISLGPIKIRAVLAILNIVLLVVGISTGSIIIRLPYLVLSSAILIAFVNFTWTLYGLELGNEFAIADGGGSLLSILSCLSLIIIVLNARLSKAAIFNLLQLPMLILFSAMSLLWVTQPIYGINTETLSQIIAPYTSLEISGGGGDLGRYGLPSAVMLPLSAFIFTIYCQRYSAIKFYIYMTFYIVSVLAIGARGTAIGALSIVSTAFIIRVFTLRKNPSNLAIFLSPVLIAAIVLSPIILESLKSTRFFEPNAQQSLAASDDVRFEQAPIMFESFLEKPILGGGFGYYVNRYYRNPTKLYLYELYFIAFLMKTGILGSLLYLLALIALLMVPFAKRFQYRPSVKILYFIAYITTLIQGATNPFLDRPCGLLLLFGPWLTIELMTKLPTESILVRKFKEPKIRSALTTQITA